MSESEPNLRKELDELKERVSALEAKIEDDPEVTRDAMDISTFVQDFDPDTHSERAAAIAFYLEKYEGQEKFTRKDIEEEYKRCRMNLPANMSDVLSSCESKGWMMRDGKDGQANVRTLTRNGLTMVQEVIENES